MLRRESVVCPVGRDNWYTGYAIEPDYKPYCEFLTGVKLRKLEGARIKTGGHHFIYVRSPPISLATTTNLTV